MDVKTTFRNLVRDQSVSICMLHQDVSMIVGWGVGDFISKPGFLYLFRSRNTFSNWEKKKSRMGNVQNFPLTPMGVFPDQE